MNLFLKQKWNSKELIIFSIANEVKKRKKKRLPYSK